MDPKSKKDSWTTKVYKYPEDLGIEIEESVVPVIQSFIVHVDETQKELYVTKPDAIATKLYLNENLSRYIRGTPIALMDQDSEIESK